MSKEEKQRFVRTVRFYWLTSAKNFTKIISFHDPFHYVNGEIKEFNRLFSILITLSQLIITYFVVIDSMKPNHPKKFC